MLSEKFFFKEIDPSSRLKESFIKVFRVFRVFWKEFIGVKTNLNVLYM